MESFARDGLTFDVRDSGPADGEPAVLLHGFPQDGSSYDGVAARLAAAGFRVLVPDQRGYSPGARPPGRRPYAVGELVDDVVALLDAAGLQSAHVVGHDWGGAVAWAIASRRAERTRTLTALSTPHPAAMAGALRTSDQALRSWYMLAFQPPGQAERLLLADDGARLRRALERSGLPRADAERYVSRMLQPGALTGALAWYRAIPLRGRFTVGWVHVPTAYLYGDRDRYFAARGASDTGRYVRAPFRFVRLDADHWLPEKNPAEVADAVLEVAGRPRRG